MSILQSMQHIEGKIQSVCLTYSLKALTLIKCFPYQPYLGLPSVTSWQGFTYFFDLPLLQAEQMEESHKRVFCSLVWSKFIIFFKIMIGVDFHGNQQLLTLCLAFRSQFPCLPPSLHPCLGLVLSSIKVLVILY